MSADGDIVQRALIQLRGDHLPNYADEDSFELATAALAALARLEASEQDAKRWLEWSGGDYPDESPGDVIHAETDGTISLDDGVGTWNPLRALTHVEENRQRIVVRLKAAEEQRDALLGAIEAAMNELGVPGPDYPAPVANAHETLRLMLVAVRAALDKETDA